MVGVVGVGGKVVVQMVKRELLHPPITGYKGLWSRGRIVKMVRELGGDRRLVWSDGGGRVVVGLAGVRWW